MENEPQTDQHLFELPEFEGQVPTGVLTKINGTGQRITRPLGIGSRVILVIEAEVGSVNHKELKEGLQRIQSLAVKDLYEVEGKDGLKLLSGMRLRSKRAEDERHGILSLDVDPKTDHGLTLDENGVALTPEEAVAARGEEQFPEGILDGPEPVVLIFNDKSRALWPDDYELTDTEPFAGDIVRNPNNKDAGDLQVIEVQNAFTGEVIELWTEELEAERLREEEEKLKAEEDSAEAKPKKKSKKAPKVIVDEITPALEADAAEEAALPSLPDEVDA